MKARYFIVETRVGTGGGERERDLRFERRSTRGSQFASIGVASNVGGGWKSVSVFSRRERRRDCRDLPTISRRPAKRRSQRRFGGSPRNIPLFRTALGSTFRPRSVEGASDSSRRRPDRLRRRFPLRTSSFENVEKCLKTRRGVCNLRRQGNLRREIEKSDGWTSTRRPAKLGSASCFETRK